jgi:hypothetical protein
MPSSQMVSLHSFKNFIKIFIYRVNPIKNI